MDDLNGGFMKLEGILRVESGTLVFEFQKKDAVIEAYKSDLMTAEIPISDLSMMEFKKGFFSNKLIIHADRPAVFNEFPGSELTERVLKFKKKHREIASNISSNVNLILSEHRLDLLKGDEE
jgi:hypothetical protein